MKIFVLCDARGNIESVAIPNPKLAARLNVEGDGVERVHILDVDSRVVTRKALLEPESSEALEKVYERLRSLIEGAEAKAPAKRAFKPAKTGRKRR